MALVIDKLALVCQHCHGAVGAELEPWGDDLRGRQRDALPLCEWPVTDGLAGGGDGMEQRRRIRARPFRRDLETVDEEGSPEM